MSLIYCGVTSDIFIYNYKSNVPVGNHRVSVAQWIAHRTSNPGVVGSSPIIDALFFKNLN